MRHFLFLLLLSFLGDNVEAQGGAKIKAYFNHPVDNSVSTTIPAIYLNHLFDDTLIAYINRAKYKIDLAIYHFSQDNTVSDIAGAINNAYTRGVKVRCIYDGSTSSTAIPLLNSGIHTLASPTTGSYGIMHNKFVVIDGNSPSPDDPVVWTGSCNLTPQQINDDVNNVIILQDRDLSKAYTAEFNEMWGDTGLIPNTSNSKFGPDKTNNTQHTFMIGGKAVELYFSPSDNTNSHILQAIGTANTELYFGMLLFSSTADADAIKNKIQNESVYTAGIMDKGSSFFSAQGTLSSAMGNMLKMYSQASSVYHNKILVADPCNIFSDPLVVTGSFNWTSAADTKNDENALIIHDDTMANIYYQSFRQNFIDLGGTLSSCPVASVNEITENRIEIFPNPSAGKINLKIGQLESGEPLTEVFNALGEKLFLSNTSRIDLGSQPDGLYLLNTTIGGKHFTSRVIIQH